MRRVAVLLSIVGVAAGALFGAVAGCGSDGDAAVIPVADGTASGSSSGEAGASSSSSSSGGTSGADAGAGTSSGAPPSNPRQLTCGASSCDAGGGGSTRVCCLRPSGAEGTCTRQDDCDNDRPDGGIAMRCDEKADCTDTDEVCCFFQTESGGDRTASTARCAESCRTGFGPGRTLPQICKTNAECGDAGACAQRTCSGFKLFVCGTPAGCN